MYVSHKYHYVRMSIRSFSPLSHFIVSISVIGLVLDDLLTINVEKNSYIVFYPSDFLHLLPMTIIISRLLPDFYEYANQ